MTSIEWTDVTWNPVTGCDRVSPGCAYCYALDLAARLKAMGQPRYQRDGDPRTSGPGFGVTLHADKLEEPVRWRRPRMVFVNSMSDLFHEAIPRDFVHDVFRVMERAEQHTFQVLTKRPERALELLRWLYTCSWCDGAGCVMCDAHDDAPPGMKSPLPNVWIGVSIENARYTWRADVLREIPAAVRFISAEPLLGSLYDVGGSGMPRYRGRRALDLTGIDWLIAGGESGVHARCMHPEWARELRDACVSRDTAFFFKQWGGRTPKAGGRDLDGRTWDEMPRARELVA